MVSLEKALWFVTGFACLTIISFILQLHTGGENNLVPIENVVKKYYQSGENKDPLKSGIPGNKESPDAGSQDNKDLLKAGFPANKDSPGLRVDNTQGTEYKDIYEVQDTPYDVADARPHEQNAKSPSASTKSVITLTTNATHSLSLQTDKIQQVDYNRTTRLKYDKNLHNIPAGNVVTFGEGCDRQFDKFLALNPNTQHIKELQNKDIIDTWNLILKYHFKIHEPVLVSREMIKPALHNSHPMPLYTLQIQLEETISGKASRGGSAFRVISASAYHVLCGFSDLFNGSYYFFCPVYGNNATVSIQLSHIDFQGYRGMTSTYDEYIWQESVTIEDKSPPVTSIKPWLESDYHQKFSSPHGLWTSGNRPLYHTNTGHVLIKQNNFICSCMKRYTFFMVGASHLRATAYCLFYSCYGHRVMRHMRYLTGTYIPEVWNVTLNLWHNATTNPVYSTMPKDQVFIVQTGSWDLGFKDFKNTTLEKLPAIMRNLSTLKERGARVIVIGTPSLPNEGTPPYKKVSRNNEITAVFNKRQADLAKQYGLEFIDMFSVTMPQYRMRPLEHGRPTHHYIVGKCKGIVGVTALELLFEKLCPDLVKNYGMWTEKIEEAYEEEKVRQKYMHKKR